MTRWSMSKSYGVECYVVAKDRWSDCPQPWDKQWPQIPPSSSFWEPLPLLELYLVLSQYKKDVWIYNIHLWNRDVLPPPPRQYLAKVLVMTWKANTEGKDGCDGSSNRFFLMPVKSLHSICSCLKIARLRWSGKRMWPCSEALFWYKRQRMLCLVTNEWPPKLQ
jgi:hypothetical protein